jgi:hypothetical protein
VVFHRRDAPVDLPSRTFVNDLRSMTSLLSMAFAVWPVT